MKAKMQLWSAWLSSELVSDRENTFCSVVPYSFGHQVFKEIAIRSLAGCQDNGTETAVNLQWQKYSVCKKRWEESLNKWMDVAETNNKS